MGERMERVRCKDAARELNMDVECLQYMLRKERLPIGYAIKRDGATRYTYHIYRGLLDAYKQHLEGGAA